MGCVDVAMRLLRQTTRAICNSSADDQYAAHIQLNVEWNSKDNYVPMSAAITVMPSVNEACQRYGVRFNISSVQGDDCLAAVKLTDVASFNISHPKSAPHNSVLNDDGTPLCPTVRVATSMFVPQTVNHDSGIVDGMGGIGCGFNVACQETPRVMAKFRNLMERTATWHMGQREAGPIVNPELSASDCIMVLQSAARWMPKTIAAEVKALARRVYHSKRKTYTLQELLQEYASIVYAGEASWFMDPIQTNEIGVLALGQRLLTNEVFFQHAAGILGIVRDESEREKAMNVIDAATGHDHEVDIAFSEREGTK